MQNFYEHLFWRTSANGCFWKMCPWIWEKLKFIKACVCYFSSNFYFFTKQMIALQKLKNIFYFIQKALFILEIFKFLYFFLFLSTLSRFKRTNGSELMMSWIGLHKFAGAIFGITQKPRYIYYTIKLCQIMYN